jgi:hypothetical protein
MRFANLKRYRGENGVQEQFITLMDLLIETHLAQGALLNKKFKSASFTKYNDTTFPRNPDSVQWTLQYSPVFSHNASSSHLTRSSDMF